MDFLTLLVAIGVLICGLLGKLVTTEIQDWLPALPRGLLERAIERLPQDIRDRYREEWLADNNDYPGKLAKIIHSLGCIIAAHRFARIATKHPDHLDSANAKNAPTNPKYRVVVWVADGLNPEERNVAVEKEIHHCASVLDELQIPQGDRIVEIRIVDRSSPLVSMSGVFSNIWNASIDV